MTSVDRIPDAVVRPAFATYEDVAGLIEHSLVRPDLSEDQVGEGCAMAREYRVAAVVVRPSDADAAVRWMEGSGVTVASVVGFPHGSTTTGAKLYETRDLLRRGVREIDAVLNVGKMISRQFPYIEMELTQLAQACRESGAILKIVFENGYLEQDLKTIACRLCKRAEVDYAQTGTENGPKVGLVDEDLALMRRLLNDKVKMKAGSGVQTLADVTRAYEAGCDRVETTATASILEEWKAELARRKQAEAVTPDTSLQPSGESSG